MKASKMRPHQRYRDPRVEVLVELSGLDQDQGLTGHAPAAQDLRSYPGVEARAVFDAAQEGPLALGLHDVHHHQGDLEEVEAALHLVIQKGCLFYSGPHFLECTLLVLYTNPLCCVFLSDKRAVDAAVQSFIEAERRQDQGGEKPKAAGDVKKLPPKPANTNVKGKKPFGGGPSTNRSGSTPRKNSNSSSSSYSKKPSSVSSVKSNNSSSSASRKPSNAPKKPLPSSSGPKKPVVSTGAKKTTGSVASKKPQANKTSNSPKAAEPFNPLNKV